jgi:hypothetical protein
LTVHRLSKETYKQTVNEVGISVRNSLYLDILATELSYKTTEAIHNEFVIKIASVQ